MPLGKGGCHWTKWKTLPKERVHRHDPYLTEVQGKALYDLVFIQNTLRLLAVVFHGRGLALHQVFAKGFSIFGNQDDLDVIRLNVLGNGRIHLV